MLCPNCKQKLDSDVIDEQQLLHCSNCGGTFFEENGINRITVKSAQSLSSDLKTTEFSTEEKQCPKDQSLLRPASGTENIPPDVTLYFCNSCKGIFALPNDLFIFKRAQSAKIDYFKIWRIPLPSIRSVAVLSVFLFISVLSLATYLYWQNQYAYKIEAEDLIKNNYVTVSSRYLFFTFTTDLPLKSKIVLSDKTTGQTIAKIINLEPDTFHQLITSEININNEIYYQIIIFDERGREGRTEMKRLEI